MRGFVARAMRAGLTKVGEPSLLRGAPCGNASLQRGVELARGDPSREDDNYVGVYDVASIDAAFNPEVDDHFDIPNAYDADGNPTAYDLFRLDRLVHDNGVIRQFIVVAR